MSDYAPCCGLAPRVVIWQRLQHTLVACNNPQCVNSLGVIAPNTKIQAEWERLRVKEKPATISGL